MFVPSDSDFDLAVQKLMEAGFRLAPWSYARSVDPQLLPDDEINRRINAKIPGYNMIDNNSVRFQFPTSFTCEERVVLIRSSYVDLSPPSNPQSMQRFHRDQSLYYPDKVLLLESFVKTLLKDSPTSRWQSTLRVWAISYMYGILMMENSSLDSCEDEAVKSWFNKAINRENGGLDRTVTKRKGKVLNPRKRDLKTGKSSSLCTE